MVTSAPLMSFFPARICKRVDFPAGDVLFLIERERERAREADLHSHRLARSSSPLEERARHRLEQAHRHPGE